MTIPTRPAPAPPASRLGQNESASANASIERLRLQLQQQQQQQQQQGGLQKLTIKLPPPPKGPTSNGVHHSTRSNNNNNNNNNSNNSSSITRKFPQARYTPTTNWDDSPFDGGLGTNGNFKKVPPPRPPPPKVQVNGVGRKPLAPTPPIQSANILANIFHRKKNVKPSNSNASRVYGVSSGIYNSSNSSHSSLTTTSQTVGTHSFTTATSASSNWNTNWNTTNNGSSSYYTTNGPAEAQLISFDSPPSSPTFTQKSNSDCVSVDSFSSDSNFSSPNNGSVSQPESGFEDDFSATRSRPATTSPLDPWETLDAFSTNDSSTATYNVTASSIGTAPVRNLNTINTRILASQDNLLCNGKSLLPPAPSLNMPTIIKPKISQKPKAPKPPSFLKQNTNNASILDEDPPTPPSPPMPQCAPPPPPGGVTLLDVISGKVDAIHLSSGATYSAETSQPYGVALYDFDGVEEGDLSFRENDKIYLLEQVSAEWYRGRTRAGCEGIFPVNYVDIKVPLGAATNSPMSATTATTYQQTNEGSKTGTYGSSCSNSSSSTSYSFSRIRCLYNFPAEVEGDLALKENDLVTILYRINEDWLYGEINGRQGQFPASFLEYVPDNIPLP